MATPGRASRRSLKRAGPRSNGLYHAGAMFGIVYDNAAPRPRQRLTSFFDVPPEVLEDRDALEAWAASAQDAARAGGTEWRH